LRHFRARPSRRHRPWPRRRRSVGPDHRRPTQRIGPLGDLDGPGRMTSAVAICSAAKRWYPLFTSTSTGSNRPSSWVLAKQLHAPVRGPGEVADGQRRGHQTNVTLPQWESQTANPLLTLPQRQGRPSKADRSTQERGRMSATAESVGTALVTGAAHGIARAAALRLTRDGWEVIVHVKSHR
jgi:hypothetical protein